MVRRTGVRIGSNGKIEGGGEMKLGGNRKARMIEIVDRGNEGRKLRENMDMNGD